MKPDYKKLILQIISDKSKKEQIGLPPEGIDPPNIETMLIERVGVDHSPSPQEIEKYISELEQEGKIYNCGYPTRPAYSVSTEEVSNGSV